MDYSKFLKDTTQEFGNNLSMKIGNPPNLTVHNCFCMWSDLLGFGDLFVENNWDMNDEQRRRIYDRLLAAHSSVLYYSSIFERNLILNDGIAKVFNSLPKDVDKDNILHISMYLRSCVELHMSISKTEHDTGYPGCRSVIAYGENIEYLANEVRLDDYIYNYTKPQGSPISNMAKYSGNPVIIYNPIELQMNIAFSKAYILEAGGSKAGLPGNNMFIDQSVIVAISKFAKDKGYMPVCYEDSEGLKFLIPYKKNDLSKVILGFCFDKKIIIPKNVRYKTTVYKLLFYYPWDEKTNEFYFDVNNPTI